MLLAACSVVWGLVVLALELVGGGVGVYYVQWAFVGCELLIWLFGVCFVSLLWLDLILWRGLLVCCELTCVARSLVWFAGECCLLF